MTLPLASFWIDHASELFHSYTEDGDLAAQVVVNRDDGASRIGVLEDAGRGTVCVYDPETGDGTMSRRQMLRYWEEALLFRPGTTRVFVIPIYTKR